MESVLYLTADEIGTPTGGGAVTYHELLALQSLGYHTNVLSRKDIDFNPSDPFDQDRKFKELVMSIYVNGTFPKLVHCYAGCLTETIRFLQSIGSKVTYTAAAHSIEESRQEHIDMGIDYDRNYPHMTIPELWNKYKEGYLLADGLVVPSTLSRDVMRGYGASKGIKIIPHGCEIPDRVAPFPSMFTVGYLGAIGPDKGVRYLLQAWKQLNYKNAMLTIAGSHSTSDYVMGLVQEYGGGCIRLAGWQDHVSTFYNNVSVVVQPSVSEGFGIEVLESLSYGRPVICSTGAGAVDLLTVVGGLWFPSKDVKELKTCIGHYRQFHGELKHDGNRFREYAKDFTWGKIRDRYVEFWKGYL